MKLKEPFAVFSNIVFLIPLYFTVLNNSHVHASITFLVFIFSTIFHAIKPPGVVWWGGLKNFTKGQKILHFFDAIFANILIIFNLFIFWQRDFPVQFWYALFIAIIALSFFFFPNERRYDFSEGIWHMLGGLITLLAVLA